MRFGIDMLLSGRRDLIEGRRLGILAHAASVDAEGRHTLARLAEDPKLEVTALFGPEHGIATLAQDMEPVETRIDSASGIPVFSLYGTTLDSLAPTPEMLGRIDALVVDLQDIGSRYYTYVWTAMLAAEACAAAGKPLIICDRPNPISGLIVEGPGIDPGFESFVGLSSIPVRHGLTLGEIVQFVNDRDRIGADITVVPMEGWHRRMSFPDTGLAWVNPSPNMRSYNAALLYPGMCLVEATNLSEGRGTDTPFELVGAPFLDTDEVMEAFTALGLPGIAVAPTSFIPNMQKWTTQLCHGIRWCVTDVQAFRPYLTGLAFLWLVHRLYKDRGFEWRSDPYEFVTNRPAIDLLTGSSRFRDSIGTLTLEQIRALAATPQDMLDARAAAVLY